MTVPIASPRVSESAKDAVRDVLDSGMLADGEVVRTFEREFAEFVGTKHAVATCNGTAALHAMLAAAGIGEGDAVVTTPLSFIATANAIVHAGAEPVFGDVDPETFTLDPATVRPILEERDDVAAILPVHLYGLPADMEAFRAMAEEHGVRLFEDAAQAHGATFDGEAVGSIGDAGAFSFYPTKNMTTGEGGMVTTDDGELAERLRRLIDHGRADHDRHVAVGYNYRMTNVAAAIGREQLTRLPGWIADRRQNAAALSDRLDDVEGVEVPTAPAGRTHAFHQYTARVDDRNGVVDSLRRSGVGFGIYYPTAIPDQPAYELVDVAIPTARSLTGCILSLPVHPDVDGDDRDLIVTAVTRGLDR